MAQPTTIQSKYLKESEKKNKLENESKTNLLSRLIILKILLAIGQALKKKTKWRQFM